MQFIQTVTVGAGGAASINFTSIPSSFTDLLVVVSGRGVASGGAIGMSLQLNNDAGANYNVRRLYNDGTTITNQTFSAATQAQLATIPAASATGSTFGNMAILITNYAGSNIKVIQVDSVTENNASFNQNLISATSWASSSAVTSVKLFPDSGNFDQYSTASLYGILKGSGGATAA